MMSDLDISSAEQRCIIKFLGKVKVKQTEIFHRLNAQYWEETQSRASVYEWHKKFSEGNNEVSNLHAHV
jgi:hypothetical protein